MRNQLIVAAALILSIGTGADAQDTGRKFYIVPGVHYGNIAKTTFALTAFLDGRQNVIGKGHLLILEGGRDLAKAQLGIANVSGRDVGYSVQVGALQVLAKPLQGVPNSRYAGTEFHLLVKVINLGVGYYAPIGDHSGRKGLTSLSFGVGF